MFSSDKDAADYFRAIVVAKERSERALELTEHLIRLNPSHYTVWFVVLLERGFDSTPIDWLNAGDIATKPS